MSKTKIAISLLFAAAALISGTYTFQAAFDESRYFPKNSLDYFLLINSGYVKTFPLPTNADARGDELEFAYSPSDQGYRVMFEHRY